jgi:type I restriction enzyme S subunit
LESGSRPKGGVGALTSGVPSLGGEHLTKDGGFDFSEIKYVSEEFFEQMPRGHIQPNDILIVKDGATTGKTAFVTEDFPHQRAAINEHIFLLRPKTDFILPRFLFFFLFGPWGQTQILACYKGAAIGGISKEFASSVQVPLPPLPEQQRIVQMLDEADQLRRLRADADRRTAKLILAIFNDIFGEQTRWPQEPLHRLLLAIESGWSPVCRDEPANPHEWGVLKLSAVTLGEYREGANKALPQEFTPRPELEVRQGDVLFTRKNTHELVAATAYVWNTRPKLMLSDLVFRLRPKPEMGIEPLYLCYSLANPAKRHEIQKLAGGAAGSMPNISKERLLSATIPLPPLQLQRVFALRATEIRALREEQDVSRQNLDDLCEALLHRAFCGEL